MPSPGSSWSKSNLLSLKNDAIEEEGYVPAMIAYPPKLLGKQIIGYITDTNEIKYSRDIGSSFQFNGVQYYMFGDTFCYDKKKQFVGVTSNTVAQVGIDSPLQSTYRNIDAKGVVKPLIPQTATEEKGEKYQGIRTAHWCFGGVIEIQPGSGLVFYQHWEIYEKERPSRMKYIGTGLAELSVSRYSRKIQAARSGKIPMFGPDEPKPGSICTLVKEGHIYLYSHMSQSVILARVSINKAHKKSEYRYWTNGCYGESWRDADNILPDMQQGQVVHTNLFGPERPFTFIGCTRFADSQITMGFSSTLEGPFTFFKLGKATGIEQPQGFMYCMYPHPWAIENNRESRGNLLVTWSEHWPGGVVAAKLKFESVEEYSYHKIFLSKYSDHVRAEVQPSKAQIQDIIKKAKVEVELEGRYVREGMQNPSGELPMALVVKGRKDQDVKIAVWHIKGMLKDYSEAEKEATQKAVKSDRGTLTRADNIEQFVEAPVASCSAPRRQSRLRQAISSVFRRQPSAATGGMGGDGTADEGDKEAI